MNGTPPPFLSDEDIAVLKRTLLRGFSEDEQESFIRQCQRTLLDPFSKQIFATRRYVRKGDAKVPSLVTVTSIMGLTAIAARTGHYDGCEISWAGKDHIWREEWLSEDEFPVAAKCVVYHKERTHPEVGIARWSGYAGTAWDPSTKRHEVSDFWARLPDFMLGKCAKAQALRGAFPDQCSNLYISEELQGGISEGSDDHLNDDEKLLEIRRREAEIIAKPPKGAKFIESVKRDQPLPTAQEAVAPAFPEDEPPPRATAPPPSVPPVQPSASSVPQEPDDLDMDGPEQPPPAGESAAPSAGAPAESATPWKTHTIVGLKNPKFFNRRVGDLSPAELAAIEAQWLPKVKQVWNEVNKAQQADALAFEAALAFYKMEKPWA